MIFGIELDEHEIFPQSYLKPPPEIISVFVFDSIPGNFHLNTPFGKIMKDSINTAPSNINMTIPYIFAFLPYQNLDKTYTRTSGIAEVTNPLIEICPRNAKRNRPGKYSKDNAIVFISSLFFISSPEIIYGQCHHILRSDATQPSRG